MALLEQGSSPIDVVISSPGGSITHGMYVVQAIKIAKERGVKVRCFVPTMAASMAYVIFTQCSERYALPFSQLLFHSPRISGSFTIDTAAAVRLAKQLQALEIVLLDLIGPVMGIGESSTEQQLAWFAESYHEERMFVATELLSEGGVAWFVIVGNITGYPGNFPPPGALRRVGK